MKTYARIDDGVVVELLSTDGDIMRMFHPSLTWIECTDVKGCAQGWRYANGELSAPTPPTTPTSEALATTARNDRDARLRLCDWVTLRAMDSGKPVPAAWLTYRQALRDVPSQKGFPTAITWPTAPEAV